MGEDLSEGSRLAAAEVARRVAGPELGPLALQQALLRRRAVAKHPQGDRLWWTAEALEQSSSLPLARHRAARFQGRDGVLDLGCSVGIDLLELAAEGHAVGVDRDEARLLLAAENARVLGRRVHLVQADLEQFAPPPGADVYADPGRRAGGRRVHRPADFSPPLDLVLSWGASARSLCIKTAPGLDYSTLPPDLEVEVVSLSGEVKEAIVWGGAVRSGVARRATLLPAGHVLESRAAPPPPVAPPGAFLLEPDGAVIRAHLVAELAADVSGWLLDPTIAYLAAAAATPTPFGRWYSVSEVLPFSLKGLRGRLRELDVGTVVVKKRGTAVEPEALRRRLALTGSRELTVILTRVAGSHVALLATPIRA